MTDPSEPLFLFGPGYSARALARLWPGPVFGTYRSETGLAILSDTKIEPVDINDEHTRLRGVRGAHVVISAAPDESGCPAFQAIGTAANGAASVTYLSTTGVYGDLAGGWAMEWSAAQPQSDRAQRRVFAEAQWRAASPNVRIVRLPGIYGPGRSSLDRLRTGKARRIIRRGQVFSRIHVDDLASGLKDLIRTRQLGVFNLCDDQAAPPQEVIAFAAELSGEAPPPDVDFDQADLSPMARSFYSECKRVSNAKIKAATGWRPLYPTYREGLTAIHRDER